MSIIEQAVARMGLLKRAGVEIGSIEEIDLQEAINKPEEHEPPERSGAGSTAARAPGGKTPGELRPVDTMPDATSRRVELDLNRLDSMGLVVPSSPRSQVAEEFRVIKRPILANAHGKGAAPVDNGNLIMVTSSVPGEGKSFNSINLAMSIAMELDNRVLLVDADVARPSVLNLLGLPPAKGLMDVLLDDEVSLPDVLLRTNVEKLTILPAGMPHKNATELLASGAMHALLVELAHRYSDRIIIFDSPPLMVTTEAPVLAQSMGQIVVIVEAGRTTHATLKQALSRVRNCPVKMVVLNKARYARTDGYYGYYGYGYGYEADRNRVPGEKVVD
ncbi:XrtA-associated tyrosine autokinase [Methyloversatilis sp. XJ19-49]|uniref:XrtA-associated tyrosine autokinase n=1 Tax=Methyloversatilis sp. XJ19-49 TaxID=2963429 RepID=UPI00211BEAEE|nr:XrtA-associated tyrosine autokinase [Methyloversatilis sp. XJ19-49]MCQ9377358.1 XrtA-associated tyrosine autokinase [Methyloversatilis sp. XJ19-49]